MTYSVHTCCQSRDVHCSGESGHFHIIVTHSDTLKRWTAVSRQPWGGGGPPTWKSLVTFCQHLFILRKSDSVSLRFNWMLQEKKIKNQQKWFDVLHFHRISLRSWKTGPGYISAPVFKTLWSGVIIGCGDALCCYRQLSRRERLLQSLMGTDSLWV